jgi:hypothetical protein
VKPCHVRAVRGAMNRCTIGAALAACVGGWTAGDAQAGTFHGPTPYLGAADSPFAGLGLTNFHLEDFEDGLFNVPGATPSAGWGVPTVSLMDSVDADDGNINGLSQGGKSYYSKFATNELIVTFDPKILGGLPTHAGIVWTDVGYVGGSMTCKGDVILEAWGPNNTYLGTLGPVWLGDGLFNGETPEDRFLGVANADGISAIRISMPDSKDFEVDHVQYGTQIVPAPGAGMVALSAIGLAITRRRR